MIAVTLLFIRMGLPHRGKRSYLESVPDFLSGPFHGVSQDLETSSPYLQEPHRKIAVVILVFCVEILPLNPALGAHPYNLRNLNQDAKRGTLMIQRSLALAAGIVILAGSLFGAPAAAQPRGFLDFLFTPRYCGPLHRTIDGDLASPCGWRYRRDYGRDYSCLYLPYLASAYACSTGGN
jgi:hypothetical protein